MADVIQSFGFENDDIKGGVFTKFKGKKGEIARIGIIYTDPKAMFVGAKAHFKDRFFLCKSGICCDKLGPSKYRVGCAIVKYNTDRMGTPKTPFSYELYPWLFSESTFIKLKTLNSEFPLASHDIKISCTNDEYQHLDITPCNETIWQAKEELKTAILNEARAIWDNVKRSVASDLSVEEIKELLGDSSGGGGSDPTTTVDLDKVLSTI